MNADNKGSVIYNRIRRVLPFNLFVWFVLLLYMLPIISMLATAMMSTEQLSDKRSPLYPARIVTYSYKGKDYQLYQVPWEGGVKQLALIKPGLKSSQFIDPQHPENGLIVWKGGRKTLTGVYEFHINWENFTVLFQALPFPAMLRNPLIIILVGEIGVLVSSIICAYGFARFSLQVGI